MSGKTPVVMHLLKMVVSGSAIIEEVSLRNRAEILSNPTAFERERERERERGERREEERGRERERERERGS